MSCLCVKVIYSVSLLPAFYSELLDYAYYRYFTKVSPSFPIL